MILPRWPDVYAGLLALLPNLSGMSDWEVFDGQPITFDNVAKWAAVGYVTDDGAGSYQQIPDPSGFATTEAGDIRCRVVAGVGDSDPTIARQQAFAFVGALQAALFADQTIGGVIPAGSVVNLSTQVMDIQNTQGSATDLLVTVTYQVTTYIS